jgi:hypothetical protein
MRRISWPTEEILNIWRRAVPCGLCYWVSYKSIVIHLWSSLQLLRLHRIAKITVRCYVGVFQQFISGMCGICTTTGHFMALHKWSFDTEQTTCTKNHAGLPNFGTNWKVCVVMTITNKPITIHITLPYTFCTISPSLTTDSNLSAL